MRTYTVRVKLYQEEDGRWSVSTPDLPGCASWGYTQEEALAHIQEAVAGYIETLLKNRLPIPLGVKAADEPIVTVTVSAA